MVLEFFVRGYGDRPWWRRRGALRSADVLSSVWLTHVPARSPLAESLKGILWSIGPFDTNIVYYFNTYMQSSRGSYIGDLVFLSGRFAVAAVLTRES